MKAIKGKRQSKDVQWLEIKMLSRRFMMCVEFNLALVLELGNLLL